MKHVLPRTGIQRYMSTHAREHRVRIQVATPTGEECYTFLREKAWGYSKHWSASHPMPQQVKLQRRMMERKQSNINREIPNPSCCQDYDQNRRQQSQPRGRVLFSSGKLRNTTFPIEHPRPLHNNFRRDRKDNKWNPNPSRRPQTSPSSNSHMANYNISEGMRDCIERYLKGEVTTTDCLNKEKRLVECKEAWK